jgi:hypothetical protein
MSDMGLGHKGRIALLGSIILNIFFVAFILGRISVFGLMPPPPPFGMGDHMPPHMMFGATPPPPFGGMMRGGMHGEMPMPPPPPFFSPADLFTPEEMKQDFAKMEENFGKMRTLRQDFGKQLEQGPVSKEDVLKHFAVIDQLMESVKKQMREKAAEKISAMSPEERKRFADRLSSE